MNLFKCVIGDVHSMKLIANVPLKYAISQFTLYKVVALPTRVSKTLFNILLTILILA